jgi:hypothetical protein
MEVPGRGVAKNDERLERDEGVSATSDLSRQPHAGGLPLEATRRHMLDGEEAPEIR